MQTVSPAMRVQLMASLPNINPENSGTPAGLKSTDVCVRQDRRQSLLSTCVSNQQKECAYHEGSSAAACQ